LARMIRKRTDAHERGTQPYDGFLVHGTIYKKLYVASSRDPEQ
jgi:hypothetical protein